MTQCHTSASMIKFSSFCPLKLYFIVRGYKGTGQIRRDGKMMHDVKTQRINKKIKGLEKDTK